MPGRALGALAVFAALVTSCTRTAEPVAAPAAAPRTASSSAPSLPSTSGVPPTPPPVTEPSCPAWEDGPVAAQAAPLTAALAAHLLDPRLAGNRVSVSVWIDGLGEVLAHNGDERLPVASNQKLLTAVGVLQELDLDTTLRTEVRRSGADLVLVAGGDPTLTSTGPHSLAALAMLVRAAGITEVTGRLVVDESRFDAARTAPGWQDWQVPTYVGPLSALTVDDNRGRTDPEFLAEPALGHGETFRRLLAAAGVRVRGPVTAGTAPDDGEVVAAVESLPVGDLLAQMLLASDNEVAESLTRDAGVRLADDGSTPAGTAALGGLLREGCAPIGAEGWADGSGLSRADLRSARELRRLVQWSRTQPWWPELGARLPVAGRSGTLAGRFRGTAAEGRVVAKTGTIIGGSALTGVVTTASGHQAVFSVVVNGDGAPAASRALDELVVALAAA